MRQFPVRLGVIGCGVTGCQHLQSAVTVPLLEFVAVADVREEVARQAADKFGVATVYTDAHRLLADARIEAVVLAMPTCIRTELALRALAAGKHVLLEKPVAMNARDVQRLISARGDLTVACCSSRYRFTPSAQAATTFIASGALGNLRLVRCRAVRAAGPPPARPPPAWRLKKALNGGGILMNWGCYDLDYLLGVCGWSLRPRLVLARHWQLAPQFAPQAASDSDAEAHLIALVCCEDGVVINLERGEFLAAQTEEAWQVLGTKGSLRLQMSASTGKTIVYDDGDATQGVVPRIVWQGDEDHATMHREVLLDFATAIREHRPPKTGLEQALMIQQITDAIYASAEQGVAVEIG